MVSCAVRRGATAAAQQQQRDDEVRQPMLGAVSRHQPSLRRRSHSRRAQGQRKWPLPDSQPRSRGERGSSRLTRFVVACGWVYHTTILPPSSAGVGIKVVKCFFVIILRLRGNQAAKQNKCRANATTGAETTSQRQEGRERDGYRSMHAKLLTRYATTTACHRPTAVDVIGEAGRIALRHTGV